MKTNTLPVVSETSQIEVETLRAKEKELKTAQKALREAQKQSAWETSVVAANPRFVVGSVRRATAEEVTELGHCHGRVCEIVCESCGEKRVVNLQDARQCRFCKACKEVADRAKSKERATSKRLSGKSVGDLEAQIAAAQAQLDAMKSTSVAC
jgi:hypothetical protein